MMNSQDKNHLASAVATEGGDASLRSHTASVLSLRARSALGARRVPTTQARTMAAVASILAGLVLLLATSCSKPPVTSAPPSFDRAFSNAPSQSTASAPASPWTNSLGMVFVSVPGTSVQFCIWETRVRDFKAFIEATNYEGGHAMIILRSRGAQSWSGYDWTYPGFEQEPSHPVVGVNWPDAQAFCAWLTTTEHSAGLIPRHKRYRLPSLWEWRRAAGEGRFPWGDVWPPPASAGNYAGTEATNSDWPEDWKTLDGFKDAFPQTAPVGSFAPDHAELYDLGGNAWEWCENLYVFSPDGKDGYAASRLLGEGLEVRQLGVLCGGSWMDRTEEALSTQGSRRCSPLERSCVAGFRVVLAPAENGESAPQAAYLGLPPQTTRPVVPSVSRTTPNFWPRHLARGVCQEGAGAAASSELAHAAAGLQDAAGLRSRKFW